MKIFVSINVHQQKRARLMNANKMRTKRIESSVRDGNSRYDPRGREPFTVEMRRMLLATFRSWAVTSLFKRPATSALPPLPPVDTSLESDARSTDSHTRAVAPPRTFSANPSRREADLQAPATTLGCSLSLFFAPYLRSICTARTVRAFETRHPDNQKFSNF